MKIAVLTDENSWLMPYSAFFCEQLEEAGIESGLYKHYEDIREPYDIVFILSYFKLVPEDFLKKYGRCLVVHESALPQGRGWAPYFWQVLEGKDRIPIVLFEASEGADTGPIYLQSEIELDGTELHDELRNKQAVKTFEMCSEYIRRSADLQPRQQEGEPDYYEKRTPAHSELDVNKTIAEQFDLLRVVSNEEYPAFFQYRGHTYELRISERP